MKSTSKNSYSLLTTHYLLLTICFIIAFLLTTHYSLLTASAQGPSNPVSNFFDSRYAPPITRLGQVADQGGGSLLVRLVNWFIAIFWIVAVGFVVWAAFQFLFAGGDETKFGEAKSKVYYALIAAVVALLATGIKPITMSLLRGGTGGGGDGGGGDQIGETTLTLNRKDCLDPFGNDEPIEITDKMVNLSLYDSAAERQLRDNPNDPIDTTISTTVAESKDKVVQYGEARNITVNICSPNLDESAICPHDSYKLYVNIKYNQYTESNSLECEIEYRE